jgi:hypothetical protein
VTVGEDGAGLLETRQCADDGRASIDGNPRFRVGRIPVRIA